MSVEAGDHCLERMRVCILTDDLTADAGTEKQIAETVMRLDPSRFEVHMCCLRDSPRLQALSRHAYTAIFPLQSMFAPSGLWQVLRFRRYVSRHRIEVIHAFTVKSAILGVLGGIGNGRCATVTSRLNTGYWYTPFYIRVFRFLNIFTTGIFTNSEVAKKIAIVAEKVPESKLTVVYNGVDTRSYAAERGDLAVPLILGIPPTVRLVGSVANLRPIKDVALFLQSAAIVSRRVRDVAFLVVGQGPLRAELERLAAELGIASAVYFSDGRGEVQDYLRRMCVGCLSSLGEGFSNAILEYMAAGLPLVATDVGGNAEAILDGVTGYLVRDRTPEAFAAPIVELLRDEERRVEMGRRGLEHCRSHFNIETYMGRVEEYYTSMIRRRSRPSH